MHNDLIVSTWSRFLAFCAVVCLCHCSHSQLTPQPAIPAILRAFDQHPIVTLGEDHWLRAAGDFYIALVSDPEFRKHANTVVLECGDSLYQPTLDRYENGEDIPFEQISQVWRNTTKVAAWDSAIYPNLIAAVREVNKTLAPADRIRVIAADSPIDWSQIHDSRDYEKAFGGNQFFASIIEREVLAKSRRAVVIMGRNHVTRGGDRWGNADVTDMVEKHHHRLSYVVLFASAVGISDSSMRGPDPLLYPIQGARAGEQRYLDRRLEDSADAVLYLPQRGRVRPDYGAIEADKGYFQEIQRRYAIVCDGAFDPKSWTWERPCPRGSERERESGSRK